jgi:hypothetical protein
MKAKENISLIKEDEYAILESLEGKECNQKLKYTE